MTGYAVEVVVPEGCDIEQAGETVALDVGADEYVLAAARSAGLWLPADCQQGWCTTCAAELLEGAVDQSDSRRYYDIDEEAGLILPCTARPCSDLRIRACQHEEMLDHRAAHDLPPGRSKRSVGGPTPDPGTGGRHATDGFDGRTGSIPVGRPRRVIAG